MRWIELALIATVALAGTISFARILWFRRVGHIWPKRNEIKVVNKAGLITGIAEVALQTRVIANRPVAGMVHLVIFYGFVSFGLKSVAHVIAGVMGLTEPIHLGPIDPFLDVIAVMVRHHDAIHRAGVHAERAHRGHEVALPGARVDERPHIAVVDDELVHVHRDVVRRQPVLP